MSYTSQNFRLVHVPNLSVLNSPTPLLMYPPSARSGPAPSRSECRLPRSHPHVRTLRADLPQPVVAAQPRQAAPGPHPVSAVSGRVRVGADAAPPPAQHPRPDGAAGLLHGAVRDDEGTARVPPAAGVGRGAAGGRCRAADAAGAADAG